MAFDTFMVIPAAPTGVPGLPQVTPEPVQDSYFAQVKAIAVVKLRSFSLSSENPPSIGSTTTATGSGKVRFNPLQVEKSIDRLSPFLFAISASGAHFPSIQLFVRKAGSATTKPYLAYEFSTAFVSRIDWSGSDGDDAPAEQIEFMYGALTLGYYPQQPDGSLGKLVKSGWSEVTNAQTGAETLPNF